MTTLTAKTRLWTLAAAVALAAALAALGHGDLAPGVLGAAAWAVLGFWVIEILVRQALVPPEQGRRRGLIALLVAAKLVLYAGAAWALLNRVVSPLGCLLGFTLLLIVLVVAGTAARPGNARPADDERGSHD
jgi:Ca2+/Na+ antiporter